MYAHRELIIYQILCFLRAKFDDLESFFNGVGIKANDISEIARDNDRFNNLKNMYYSRRSVQ